MKDFDIHSFKEILKTKYLGKEFIYFNNVDSTNDEALRIAEEKPLNGTVVLAEVQTLGRGRGEKPWLSPYGGLWFSIILKPKISPLIISIITLLSGLAVAETIKESLNLDAKIKWPNDILIDNLKVAGILCESEILKNKIKKLVIGIGVNLNLDKEDIEGLDIKATSCKIELGNEVNREKFLAHFLQKFENYYSKIIVSSEFEYILNKIRKIIIPIGSNVEIKTENEKLSGYAFDLANNGSLLVKIDNQIKAFTSSNIEYIRIKK
ncbi:MAG: biotin--[acetyl-CoA-carboxylase] ligase [Actinomycetota bacterium]